MRTGALRSRNGACGRSRKPERFPWTAGPPIGDGMSVRIGLALGGLPLGESGGLFFEIVDQAEELGFDSLWLSDRLVSTVPTLEPITSLAMVAARTTKLKFGMSV